MHRGRIYAKLAFAIASAFLISSAAWAEDSYNDPGPSGAPVSAVGWLEGTLLGTIATVVTVIAVAMIGFMMLSGRIDVRRSVQVILGCFIIFGAATIASGLIAAMSLSRSGSDESPPVQQVVRAPTPIVPVKSVPAVSDPYAGAAVPQR